MFWTKIKTLMCDLERLQCVVKRHDYRLQYAEEAYKAIETENKRLNKQLNALYNYFNLDYYNGLPPIPYCAPRV